MTIKDNEPPRLIQSYITFPSLRHIRACNVSISRTCLQIHTSGANIYTIMDHVYILLCSDGTLYTGWTNDLEKRLEAHNSGKGARYTRGRRPVVLVYTEDFEEKGAALRREAAIKKLSRKEKLALIGPDRLKHATRQPRQPREIDNGFTVDI